MGAGVRRKGRWYALQVLYALDLNPEQSVAQAMAGLGGEGDPSTGSGHGEELDDRSLAFARELIDACRERRAEIDDIIQAASRNWRIERMSRVDRNILRLATSELIGGEAVPTKVVINEAVELAKRFGASEAPAFVNGILDRIAHGVRKG